MTVQGLLDALRDGRFGPDMQVYVRDHDDTEWTTGLPYVENSRCYIDVEMALLLVE